MKRANAGFSIEEPKLCDFQFLFQHSHWDFSKIKNPRIKLSHEKAALDGRLFHGN
ncbi:hypothetical protein CAGA_04690 [Caproiciproducens galactitolivorans]|uniref:Uncharacterized protein n=1 Tax=Caproiciproducens galactitolivorans TaxID=642589 RepID=A0A4Z0Y5C1_9FIRM|nr:hypothetical protein CAGA_04690 [Caproiciproducens galactitolivorans]